MGHDVYPHGTLGFFDLTSVDFFSQVPYRKSYVLGQLGSRATPVESWIILFMTNQYGPSEPHAQNGNNSQTPSETQSFERVNSPYSQQPNSYQTPPNEGEHTSQPPQQEWTNTSISEPQVVQPKQKRTMPFSGAIALALAAAVGAGSITGIVVSNNNDSSSSQTAVVDSLKSEPVANSTGHEAEAGSVEAVAQRVLPSVVSIQVMTGRGMSEGSGSIISADGYVMTNNHVVQSAENSQARIVVSLNDGTEYQADVVAGDPNTDVAVIKLRDASNLPVMNFGDSDSLKVGQEVIAVGSPLGLSATVTSGIVSALNRPVRAGGTSMGESSLIDAVQTDAAINPGNSGGPLVDIEGNLIGMNSVIASTSTTGSEAGSIGLGFAIPSNFARRVASQLIENGQATQPMIGIQLASNANVSGALIAEVTPGGPGDQAGLQKDEIITGMNDRRIDSADALIAAVRSQNFGETITLKVEDSNRGNQREVQVTLTSE